MKLYVERISLNGIKVDREGCEELEDDPTSGRPSPAPNPGTVAKEVRELLATEGRPTD